MAVSQAPALEDHQQLAWISLTALCWLNFCAVLDIIKKVSTSKMSAYRVLRRNIKVEYNFDLCCTFHRHGICQMPRNKCSTATAAMLTKCYLDVTYFISLKRESMRFDNGSIKTIIIRFVWLVKAIVSINHTRTSSTSQIPATYRYCHIT